MQFHIFFPMYSLLDRDSMCCAVCQKKRMMLLCSTDKMELTVINSFAVMFYGMCNITELRNTECWARMCVVGDGHDVCMLYGMHLRSLSRTFSGVWSM